MSATLSRAFPPLVLLIALFVSACRDQQPTPVAPSATLPTPAPLSLDATRVASVEHVSESWNLAATTGYDTYVWDFGDNTEKETTHVWATVHSYTVPRVYSATVAATGTNGIRTYATHDVRVTLVK